jgi:hypothetical protein
VFAEFIFRQYICQALSRIWQLGKLDKILFLYSIKIFIKLTDEKAYKNWHINERGVPQVSKQYHIIQINQKD